MRFAPNGDRRFIDVHRPYGLSNITPYIVDSRDLGPQIALQCMAMVGNSGCGVASPLEAAKRALDGHLAANHDFFRNYSSKFVIFVTDKDHCSVQSERRQENDPQVISSFEVGGQTYACDTANGVDVPAGCYSREYRCLARAIECDEPLNAPGRKHNCHPKPASYLRPTHEYAQFFASLTSREWLHFLGFWPGSMADNPQSDSAQPGQVVIAAASDGSTNTAGLHAASQSDAACYNPNIPGAGGRDGYSGQPQVRLSDFLRRFDPRSYREADVCNAEGYGQQLGTRPNLTRLVDGTSDCLSLRPKRDGLTGPGDGVQGQAACQVGYVDENDEAGVPDVLLPQCGDTCCRGWISESLMTRDSSVIKTACAAETEDCFCAVESDIRCIGVGSRNSVRLIPEILAGWVVFSV